mgnify:CR=1|tara:strand:+ start:71 stop:574 length:504 start_codon:yes stop_codon:yes gene_type:complete
MDYNELIEGGKATAEFVRSGFGALKIAREALRKSGGDSVETAALELTLREVEDQLAGARQSQMALIDALLEAKQEMIEFDRTLELKRRYEPIQTGGGALVLKLRDQYKGTEPDHCICPDCAENGKRSFLQPRGTGKKCGPCARFFPFEPEDNRSRTVQTFRRGNWLD